MIWNKRCCGDYKDEETKLITSVLHSMYKSFCGFNRAEAFGKMSLGFFSPLFSKNVIQRCHYISLPPFHIVVCFILFTVPIRYTRFTKREFLPSEFFPPDIILIWFRKLLLKIILRHRGGRWWEVAALSRLNYVPRVEMNPQSARVKRWGF